MSETWRLKHVRYNHCDGGCYVFKRDGVPGAMHIPINMFWGHTRWRWWADASGGWPKEAVSSSDQSDH